MPGPAIAMGWLPIVLAPPAEVDTEKARAEVVAEAEAIYDETRRDVQAELDRLETVRDWATREMDLITARAKRDLDLGADSDEVERRVQAELDAVMKQAMTPGFLPPGEAKGDAVVEPRPPEPSVPVATGTEGEPTAPAPEPEPSPTDPRDATTDEDAPPTAVSEDTAAMARGHRGSVPWVLAVGSIAVVALVWALVRRRAA